MNRGCIILTALAAGGVVTFGPVLASVTPNVYTCQNSWPEGTQSRAVLAVTDSEGDVDTHTVISTLPPGGPYTPEEAAAVVCADIDSAAFVTCTLSGATITLSATEPGTTLESSITLVQ